MNSLLTGLWFFSSLIYNGQELPRPNPDLVMTLEFNDPNINTLRYQRKDERGFCERKALYRYQKNALEQTVTWIHPQNADFCAQDLDMQVGQVSTTRVEISDKKLLMYLNLSGESLIYVWTPTLTPQL